MASKKKKSKIRTQFRKNREVRTRKSDWTREFERHGFEDRDTQSGERVSGKGDLTRQRTVVGTQSEDSETGLGVHLQVDDESCLSGRVMQVRGLTNLVGTEDGSQFLCATRRLLKSLSTDQRNVVVVGDRVRFRPEATSEEMGEGIIQAVEPRHGIISRTSRGRQHIIVANVEVQVIVTSAAEPDIKPHLIDRFLVTAEKSGMQPLVVINKIDLVHPASLQPLVGVYSQMGYRVLLASVKTGRGIDRLRRAMRGRQSVVTGQSGVGKSSLLNAMDETMQLRVGEVSKDSQKGRHTTTTAELRRLSFGGYVVDTPGIRQFQLWDVIPEEVAGFFRDIRPYVSRCRFPDCSHTHEDECAVKDAVADDLLDARRYESYCHMYDDPGGNW